jgi:hypothetical protein
MLLYLKQAIGDPSRAPLTGRLRSASAQARRGVLWWLSLQEYAMVFESRGSGRPFGVGPHAGELVADYRARLAHEHAEMQERRQAELAEQVSIRNMPSERIRIWERLHGLPLPRNPTHNLLSVIAAATDLQLEQVLEEQRLRRAAAKGTVASQAPIETDHLNPSI